MKLSSLQPFFTFLRPVVKWIPRKSMWRTHNPLLSRDTKYRESIGICGEHISQTKWSYQILLQGFLCLCLWPGYKISEGPCLGHLFSSCLTQSLGQRKCSVNVCWLGPSLNSIDSSPSYSPLQTLVQEFTALSTSNIVGQLILIWGVVLCIGGCSVASLASALQMLVLNPAVVTKLSTNVVRCHLEGKVPVLPQPLLRITALGESDIFRSHSFFVLAALDLCCWEQAFPNCGKWGLLSSCDTRASHFSGFSLGSMSSSVSPVLVAHWLRCPAACSILPDQESNLWPLHWQVDS